MIPRVTLGRTGLQVSQLCFGTGSHGWNGHSDQSALGVEGLADLLRHAYDRGITFWDTAHQYGTHPHVAAALRGVDRASVTIATKTTSKTEADVADDVERFCAELGTEYVDIAILHCMTLPDWTTDMAGPMEALARARDRGLVRAVGVSCHDFGALTASATTDWGDVNLVRINRAGVNMCAAPDQVVPLIAQMQRAGKGVYGMKVLGCGEGGLTADPAGALGYALDVPGIDAVVVGLVSRDQVDQIADLVSARV